MNMKYLKIFLENFVVTFIIYLLFFKYSSFKVDYLNMNIHPIAIAIGLQSLRYGIYYSLPIVIFSLFFFILPYYELGYDIVLFFLSYKYYKFIIMFLFVYLVLGRAKDQFDFKMEVMQNAREKERQNSKMLQLAYADSQKVVEILKTRIVESKESLLNLEYINKILQKSDKEEILTYGMILVKNYIHTNVANLYLYNEEKNYITSKISLGNSSYEKIIFLNEQTEEFNEIISQRKIVEIFNKDKEIRQYGAPLFKGDKIFAIIFVEKLEYNYKDLYQLEMFQLVVHKIQESLNIYFKNNKKIESCENEIYPMPLFEKFEKSLEKRKEELEVDYMVLEYDKNEELMKAIEENILSTFRENCHLFSNNKFIKILIENIKSDEKIKIKSDIDTILGKESLYEI